MASKKPRRTTAQGSVTGTRELSSSETGKANAEGGSDKLPPREIDGPVAAARGNIGMTIPTEIRFEMLRFDTGGELPCSVEDFRSGKAHAELYEILKREFRALYKMGKEGLELE